MVSYCTLKLDLFCNIVDVSLLIQAASSVDPWTFNEYQISVSFKLGSNTLTPKRVHTKTQKVTWYIIIHFSEECNDLYVGETKQPLNKWLA